MSPFDAREESVITTSTLFYFAYGSNADPDRFRDRVGDWRSRRPAWIDGHRLRFAASVQSEGGGGAVIDPAEGEQVAGVVYEITPEQMAAMDREEFDPTRNTSGAGRRSTMTVRTDEGTLSVEVYHLEDDGGRRAPSERYLGFILRGLEAAGHGPDALEHVRRAAAEAG